METTTSQTISVGAFTMTGNSVSGPADYIKSAQYTATVEAILAGRNVVFNYGSQRVGKAGFAASIEAAFLVAIQTDYAAWRGLQTLGLGGRS